MAVHGTFLRLATLKSEVFPHNMTELIAEWKLFMSILIFIQSNPFLIVVRNECMSECTVEAKYFTSHIRCMARISLWHYGSHGPQTLSAPIGRLIHGWNPLIMNLLLHLLSLLAFHACFELERTKKEAKSKADGWFMSHNNFFLLHNFIQLFTWFCTVHS